MKLHSYIDIIRYVLYCLLCLDLTFPIRVSQTVELKQVEGGREEINIISRPGLQWRQTGVGWCLLCSSTVHSLYGQQLLYQAIANHHLAGGSMAVSAPVKLSLACLATQYITGKGKRKLYYFAWSACLVCRVVL